MGAPEQLGSPGWAQVHLLQAIYHELRYSNDKASAQALAEHAEAMHHLGGDMRGLGDALNHQR